MDIKFDFKGAPTGGCIFNYLLEKSRIPFQAESERNFHIFYQLIYGADEGILEQLGLVRDTTVYNYLTNNIEIDGANEKNKFDAMYAALEVCNIKDQHQMVFKKTAQITKV
jgi:myosin heavy subunit